MKSFSLKACAVCVSIMLAACSNTSADDASDNTSPDNSSADSPSSVGASAGARSVIVLTDPQGDVETVGRRAEDYDEATPNPQQKHGDIVASSVEHTATEVLVRIDLAYLVPPGPSDTYLAEADIETNEVRHRSPQQTWVSVSFGAWRGSRMESESLVRIDCPSLDHTIDYDHDEVTLSIPRSCLREPEWVRVGLSFVITLEDGVTTLDDGLRVGYRQFSDVFSAWLPKPAWIPKP